MQHTGRGMVNEEHCLLLYFLFCLDFMNCARCKCKHIVAYGVTNCGGACVVGLDEPIHTIRELCRGAKWVTGGGAVRERESYDDGREYGKNEN